jgi:hypothetical protein
MKFSVFHPCDKNKNAARMECPAAQPDLLVADEGAIV